MLVVVTGGSGSGKSEYAEQLAAALQKEQEALTGRTLQLQYVATMLPSDEEDQRRIERHRRLRAGKNFHTTECPYDLAGLQVEAHSIILLECMSNLVANELYSESRGMENCVEVIKKGITHCMDLAASVIIVTNEIHSDGGWCSWDGLPDYMQQLGEINQAMAALAEVVVEVVYGIPIVRKGGENWKLLS